MSEILQALAEAAARGDRRAMERLLRELYDRVAAVTRRICGPDHDDATQQALISIVRGIERFDGRASVTTWAYRIATNAALDELRRRKRHAAVELDDRPLEDRGRDAVAQVDDRLAVEAALDGLRPEYRAAIVLREVAGFDYAEIAETLGVPVGTVRSRISRARRHLADAIGAGNQSDSRNVEPHTP